MKAIPLLRLLILILLLIVSFYGPAFSQFTQLPRWEAGVVGGPIGFLGDLGGSHGRAGAFLKDYNWQGTRCGEGVYIGYHPADWLELQLSLMHGAVAGNDAWIKPDKSGEGESRKDRNLDFRSPLNEFALTANLYPTVWLEKSANGAANKKLRPYLSTGLGLFHFNPQGVYTAPNGRSSWVNLRPLHTEGEGFPEYPHRKMYALTQLCIPMGMGVTYFITDRVTLSGEFIGTKTFTDYIDDVSTEFADPSLFYKYLSPTVAPIADYMSNKSPLRNTPGSAYQPGDKRGNPGNKDGYIRFGIRLGIRLGKTFDPWPLSPGATKY